MADSRTSASEKRMGPQNSASREKMFDAAEDILQRLGYQALTARRVAEVAGFNHQTVYYYFSSMDDLVTGAFRRRAETSLQRLTECVRLERPLHRLVELIADQGNTILSLEYAAIGTHMEQLASEIRLFLDQSRDIEERVITEALANRGKSDTELTPQMAAMVIAALGQFLAREAALGFDRGHAEMEIFLKRLLKRFEPDQDLVLRKHLTD